MLSFFLYLCYFQWLHWTFQHIYGQNILKISTACYQMRLLLCQSPLWLLSFKNIHKVIQNTRWGKEKKE